MKIVTLLYCEHEETDDRLQYHISHPGKVDSIEATFVCSGDKNIQEFLYNFEHHLKQYGLHELWFQHNGYISPVDVSVTKLKIPVVRILAYCQQYMLYLNQ